MSDTESPRVCTTPASERMMSSDDLSNLVDRRVAVAVKALQSQILLQERLVDQRFATTRDLREASMEALGAASLARSTALSSLMEARINGERERADERFVGLKTYVIERAARDEALVDRHLLELRELIFAQIDLREKARELQAIEYERRLDGLNDENGRIAAAQGVYVRQDIYGKDMDRLYQERRDQTSAAETARLMSENTASTTRRNTMLTAITAGISLIAVIISILLHFSPIPGVM